MGSTNMGSTNQQLDIIHKKAIRMLTHSKYNAHAEPLFKKMELLKLSDICRLQEMKFYYKLVNKQLPIYFNTFNHQANSDINDHNTRTVFDLISEHTLISRHPPFCAGEDYCQST